MQIKWDAAHCSQSKTFFPWSKRFLTKTLLPFLCAADKCALTSNTIWSIFGNNSSFRTCMCTFSDLRVKFAVSSIRSVSDNGFKLMRNVSIEDHIWLKSASSVMSSKLFIIDWNTVREITICWSWVHWLANFAKRGYKEYMITVQIIKGLGHT